MMGAPLSLRHKMDWIAKEELESKEPREKMTKMRRGGEDVHAERKRPKRDRPCTLPIIERTLELRFARIGKREA